MKVKQDYSGTVLDALNEAIVINVADCDALAFQVTGTFTATLSVEASIDGTNYVNLAGTNVGSNSSTSSLTAAGIWRAGYATVYGFEFVRIRVSAYTSGSATVVWQTARSSK